MVILLASRFLAQQPPPEDDIFDIVVFEPKDSQLGLWIWIGVILLLLALGAIGAFLLIRKLSRKKQDLSPEGIVSRTLRDLSRRKGEMEPNEFSLAISDALKDYLVARFKDPVRYETTPEFLKRSSLEQSELPSDAQASLRQFLATSEAVKFGNLPDADERAEPLLGLAASIVKQCQSALHAETKRKK